MSKGGGGGAVTGFNYYMGLFMGLYRGPIDEIVEIKINDLTAWTGSVTETSAFALSKPDLFGGDEKEGGVEGIVQVYMGEPDQILSDDVKASLHGAGLNTVPDDADFFEADPVEVVIPVSTGPIPGFRGVATLFYRGKIAANNPYLKAWSIRARRIVKGWDGDCWYPEAATILLSSGQPNTLANDIHAMNGAHIIYECATNGVWGRGLDRSLIDDAAFRAAALQLYNEGFGLCMRFTRQDNLSAFVQQVVDHIGAAVYIDKTTGLFTLKLIRDDYDPTVLPLFDANSGLLDVTEDTSGSQDMTANEVIVKYVDPIRNQARQARAQNLASFESIGSIISTTVDYSGVPTPGLAARVALRDLKVTANALKKFTVKVDRRGWRLAPAGVFRISDPSRGISDMVLRIGKVEDGTGSDGAIVLTCAQDVFGLPLTGFVGVQQPLWSVPTNVPAIPTRQVIQEANYRDLARSLSAGTLAAMTPDQGTEMVMASRPNQTSSMYDLVTGADGEALVVRARGPWCASGRMEGSIGIRDATFTLTGLSQPDLIVVGMAVYMDNEWMRLDDFNPATGECSVGRGCIDTIPAAHTHCIVYFGDRAEVSDAREYVSGEVISAKVLTVTSTDRLAPDLAPTLTVTMAGRASRPYPPGLVREEGTLYGDTPPAAGTTPTDHWIQWAHRDRLTELDALISQEDGDIGPEAGTTYTIRIYDISGPLLATYAGLVGTLFIYDTTMQGTDGASGTVRVELESVRDGLVSFQHYSFLMNLTRVGWGYAWGSDWSSL